MNIDNCPMCGKAPRVDRNEHTSDFRAACIPCQWPVVTIEADLESGREEGEAFAIQEPTREAALAAWNDHCAEARGDAA